MITYFSIDRYETHCNYWLQETDMDGIPVMREVTKAEYHEALNQLAKGCFSDQYKRFPTKRGAEYYYIPSLPAHLR